MAVRLGADGTTSSIADLRSLGATFICRYVSDYSWKNLTPSEAANLSAAGIDIVTNWENDVSDWEGGYAQGRAYGARAWAQHKACGGPDGRPIYFSVDMDADPTDQRLYDYFRGLQDALTPGQVGVYGSTAVCLSLKAAGRAAWFWRTMSTSFRGGYGDPSDFNIEQTGFFSSSYDRDASITDDFGQWRVGENFTPAPAPTPTGDTVTPQDLQSAVDNINSHIASLTQAGVDNVNSHIAAAVNPLQAQLNALKDELDAVKAKLGA